MCPGGTLRPQQPPPGSDPSVCPRPVLGTYDDHDSGWNNGNDRLVGGRQGRVGGERGREMEGLAPIAGAVSDPFQLRRVICSLSPQPGKQIVKNLFLDAIGEPQDSPRRTAMAGLQTSYTLRGGGKEPEGGPSAGASGGGTTGGTGGTTQEVQVVLLDERYYRDTVPCSVREDW